MAEIFNPKYNSLPKQVDENKDKIEELEDAFDTLAEGVEELDENKQDKLIAGQNITLTETPEGVQIDATDLDTNVDVQIDGTSIVNNKVANIKTINNDYNANTNKIATESDLGICVQRVPNEYIVYGRGSNGETTFNIDHTSNVEPNYIVKRSLGGNVKVPQTPYSDDYAASKKYVDDAVAGAGGGIDTLTGNITIDLDAQNFNYSGLYYVNCNTLILQSSSSGYNIYEFYDIKGYIYFTPIYEYNTEDCVSIVLNRYTNDNGNRYILTTATYSRTTHATYQSNDMDLDFIVNKAQNFTFDFVIGSNYIGLGELFFQVGTNGNGTIRFENDIYDTFSICDDNNQTNVYDTLDGDKVRGSICYMNTTYDSSYVAQESSFLFFLPNGEVRKYVYDLQNHRLLDLQIINLEEINETMSCHNITFSFDFENDNGDPYHLAGSLFIISNDYTTPITTANNFIELLQSKEGLITCNGWFNSDADPTTQSVVSISSNIDYDNPSYPDGLETFNINYLTKTTNPTHLGVNTESFTYDINDFNLESTITNFTIQDSIDEI